MNNAMSDIDIVWFSPNWLSFHLDFFPEYNLNSLIHV